MTAKMYSGRPDRCGAYYQLKFIGEVRRLPEYIKIENEYFVVLTRVDRKNYAIIEDYIR
jgi:hypothetical protein